MTLTFDADGQLTGPSVLNFGIPGGEPFSLDMAGMTQLAGEYNVTGTSNGNAPSAVKDVEFAADGTVYAVYEDGTRVGAYRIPLANVSRARTTSSPAPATSMRRRRAPAVIRSASPKCPASAPSHLARSKDRMSISAPSSRP